MSEHNRNIKEGIQRLSGLWGKDYVGVIDCEVMSVDEAKRTCKVTPITGEAAVEIEVSISAMPNDGFILVPEVGSTVVCAVTNKHQFFIVQYSDLQKVRITIGQFEILMTQSELLLGDGSFDGLMKVDEMKTQYDAGIAAIKAAVAAGFTALAGIDGGASLNAFNAAAASIQNLNAALLKNNKIKHGV